MFFAHSENAKGEKHKLTDNLLRTAGLARSFAASKKEVAVDASQKRIPVGWIVNPTYKAGRKRNRHSLEA